MIFVLVAITTICHNSLQDKLGGVLENLGNLPHDGQKTEIIEYKMFKSKNSKYCQNIIDGKIALSF